MAIPLYEMANEIKFKIMQKQISLEILYEISDPLCLTKHDCALAKMFKKY